MDKKINEKIEVLLKNNKDGLTITDIVAKSKFSRCGVRSALARLEGAKKVSFKKIGMAKVYTFRK